MNGKSISIRSFTRVTSALAIAGFCALHAASMRAQQPKVYHSGGIISVASGKGLDVRDQSRADGADIQVWDFANAPNQQWDILEVREGVYHIQNKLSRKSLDVADKNVANGANVQQFGFNNGVNQLWRIQKTSGGVQIVGVASSKCLDVDLDKAKENGANVQVWQCGGGRNQLWRLGNK